MVLEGGRQDLSMPAASPTDAIRPKTQSVGKTISIDSIVAPTHARTKDLKRLNALPADAIVLSGKMRPETSVMVPAGPMLATELVASPTTLPALSASPSSPDSPSLRDYKRSSRPASLDYGQRSLGTFEPGVIKANSGRGGINDINDIHYQVTTSRELAITSPSGSGTAGPATEGLVQKHAPAKEKFRIVDADFESNIEDLLAQLEAAGISEKDPEKEEDKQKSLADLEPRLDMARLVYEVA